MMQEQRSELRRKSFLGGQIAFASRYATLDCVLRNTSDSGARLALPDARTLPDAFDLYVPVKGQHFRADVKWRHLDAVGVQLRRTLPPGVISLDEARKSRTQPE
jgi:hypothetical protein